VPKAYPPETLRQWIRKGEVDAGQRPGVTSEESAEIGRLKRIQRRHRKSGLR
jgi:transposase